MKTFIYTMLAVLSFCICGCSVNSENDGEGKLVIYEDSGESKDGGEEDRDVNEGEDDVVISDDDIEDKPEERPLRRVVPFECKANPIYYGAEGSICATSEERHPIGSLGERDNCRKNSDCREREHGYCAYAQDEGGVIHWCECVYDQCQQDEDCLDGYACACKYTFLRTIGYPDYGTGDYYNICVRSECLSDADCPKGEYCQAALYYDYLNVLGSRHLLGFFCSTPYDSCASHEDCCQTQTSKNCFQSCTYGSRVDPALLKRHEEHYFVTDTDEPHWHCMHSDYPEDD